MQRPQGVQDANEASHGQFGRARVIPPTGGMVGMSDRLGTTWAKSVIDSTPSKGKCAPRYSSWVRCPSLVVLCSSTMRMS